MICGKTIYTSQGEAVSAISGMHGDRRPTKANRKPQHAYWCDPCNGWHIHSKQKKHVKKSKSREIKTEKLGDVKHKYNHNSLVIKNFTSKPIK